MVQATIAVSRTLSKIPDTILEHSATQSIQARLFIPVFSRPTSAPFGPKARCRI